MTIIVHDIWYMHYPEISRRLTDGLEVHERRSAAGLLPDSEKANVRILVRFIAVVDPVLVSSDRKLHIGLVS